MMNLNKIDVSEALKWWHSLSMDEQDVYLEKHFPNRLKSNVRTVATNIYEI